MNAEQELHVEVERLVALASGGAITVDELRAADGSLEAVGMNSIAYINLMEALEQTLGVVIDPDDDPEYLTSIASISMFVQSQRQIPPIATR